MLGTKFYGFRDIYWKSNFLSISDDCSKIIMRYSRNDGIVVVSCHFGLSFGLQCSVIWLRNGIDVRYDHKKLKNIGGCYVLKNFRTKVA